MPQRVEPTRRSLRETHTRSRRLKKIRAVLASGLILGIGSTVTLAAWQDEQYASTTITASTFQLEGSTDGQQYHRSTSSEDGASELDFGLEDTGIAPGETVYALFSVRTTENSTVGGELWMTADSANIDGLGEWLRYAVSITEEPQCEDSADFTDGTEIIPRQAAASLAESPGTDQSRQLPAGDGGAVNYCFEVTLPEETPNTAQGQSLEANWTFHGQSS